MDTKDWLDIALLTWANTIATIALVHTLRKDKTAPRKPSKQRRKR